MRVVQAVSDTGGVAMGDDLQYARAKRFLNRLRDLPFIAILVDEENDVVRMYNKGCRIDSDSLRKIRAHLDDLERQMKEQDGQDDCQEGQ